MSTLKVNEIQDTSGGSSNLTIPGAAKAWVNFNGTGTVAIRDDLNVSSITDNGAGDYTINFTTAIGNTNYAMVGTGSLDSRTETIVVTGYTEATRLSGSIRVNTRYDNSIATNGVNVDVSTVAVAIHGN